MAEWQNRIVGHEDVAPDQLLANPFNFRVHTEKQQKWAHASLSELGWLDEVKVNRNTGHMVDGHLRVTLAMRHDQPTVPVTYLDLTDQEEKKALAVYDRIASMAIEDEATLAGLCEEIEFDDADALAEALSELAGVEFSLPAEPPSEDAPEPPDAPVSKPGDLWLLGHHRLVCGDSTSADDVARAMGDLKPHLMVTDPPYGVNYDPEWRDGAELGAGPNIGKVANDDEADWGPAWALFGGDVAYVWHAGRMASAVQGSLERAGFLVRGQIIWAKPWMIISRGHYHWQHEPCWYAVRIGATGHWNGDRKQTTLWKIEKSAEDEHTHHGTQKPIEAMRRPIVNNSQPGDAVYDPFLGSGTTLVAAEAEGRICVGLELDPAYCDVIVERWQKYTGQDATLDGDGRTFNEIANGQR